MKEVKPMGSKKEYKDVDGVKCPEKFFTSYDLSVYDCVFCGRPKHYVSCSLTGTQGACYGWGTEEKGPMYCKNYVLYVDKNGKPN